MDPKESQFSLSNPWSSFYLGYNHQLLGFQVTAFSIQVSVYDFMNKDLFLKLLTLLGPGVLFNSIWDELASSDYKSNAASQSNGESNYCQPRPRGKEILQSFQNNVKYSFAFYCARKCVTGLTIN